MTQCLFCKNEATISLCMHHARKIRLPEIKYTGNNEFPREHMDCFIQIEDGVVGMASYDGESWRDDYDNYVAAPEDPVYWIPALYLEDLYKMFQELASDARKLRNK